MKWSTVGLLGAAGVMTATASNGAEPVALFLKAAGTTINGENTQSSLGRAGSIECIQLDYGVRGAAEARRYETIRCLKRIDKSSPLLMRHFVAGSLIDGTFKFFRPNPTGDGTTEQFYTVNIKGGRIESVRNHVPNQLDPSVNKMAPLEEVTFSFRTINYTFTNGGITFEDTAPATPSGSTQISPLTR